jgi:hypothetical protein
MPCAVNCEMASFLTNSIRRMMTMAPKPQPAAGGEAMPELDVAADKLIADCGGDPHAAVKALIVANAHLEQELKLARVAVSSGFSRQWHAKRREPGDV